MPDNIGSQSIQQEPEQQRPAVSGGNSPAAPNNPLGTAAQSATDNGGKTEIQQLEDRMRRAEKWMIWLTAAIAFFGLCSVVVAFLQWRSSENQGVDTHNLAVAAGH